MAGNTISITLAGDATSLDRALDRAGKSAIDAGRDFDKAGSQAKGFGKSMDSASDAVDKSEGKFMATADLLDGLGEAFGLPLSGAVSMGRAFADIAGGLTGAVIPAVQGVLTKLGLMTAATTAQAGATEAATVAQTGLNTTFSLSPVGQITLAIGALVAVGVLLVKNWDTIKKAASAVWGGLVDFFGGISDRIGSAAGKMFDPILGAAKAVINAVIGLFETGLNIATAPFRAAGGIVNFFSSKVGIEVPEIFRKKINLPSLHTGGTVPGPPGTQVPIMALAGEQVSPRGGAAAGLTVIVQGHVLDGRQLADLVHSALLTKQRNTGSLGLTA